MDVVRAFIAIDLTSEIQQSLDQILRDLKGNVGKASVRWIPVENIHLTIKFLGDVSVDKLDLLKNAIQSEIHRHTSFGIKVGELGTFPSVRRPRVIWVGVEAPKELQSLHKGIEKETARLGYPPDDRSFSPHLTIGRVSRNDNPGELRRISETLQNHKVGLLGAMQVESMHLYRSDLRPGGAIYSRLFSASLVGENPKQT